MNVGKQQMTKNLKTCVIESMEHTTDDVIYWWKPDRKGYTPFIEEAGMYSEAEAKKIVAGAGEKNEKYWFLSEVLTGEAGMVGKVVLKR